MPPRPAKAGVPKPAKSAAETRSIFAKLSTQHPNADTELHFRNPYELLVATILSAQCTDERVNQVTPALFARYPDAKALAKSTTAELEPQIMSTGFFRAKSRALLGMATELVESHGGDVPGSMDQLVMLPGVGRKTANVVLGHALGVPGLPVDRHVLRVANRIGIAKSEEPEIVEQQLGAALPPADWTRASDTLILHGRRICKPKPLCPLCVVRPDCLYYRNVVSKFAAAAPKAGESGRAAKPRGTNRGEASHERFESRQTVESRRAPKPRGRGRTSTARQSLSEKVETVEPRRAPKVRGTVRTSTAPQSLSEKVETVESRRAPKVRGTGRGGGAPRQSK